MNIHSQAPDYSPGAFWNWQLKAHHSIGVLDTEGKFTAGVNNTGDHIFSEIYIDHGVNNTGSKLPLVSATPAVNCTSGTVAGPLLPL